MAVSFLFPLSISLAEPGHGFIKVAPDQWSFRFSLTGEPFVPIGVNYDHDGQGRLLEDYWEEEWPKLEEDFAEIAAMGFNVVRIHLQYWRFQLGPGLPDEAQFDRLDKLIALAEKNDLYLDLTGLAHYDDKKIPAWFLAMNDDAMMRAEAAFWEDVATRYAGAEAIFCYDLQNEPSINYEDTKDIVGPPFGGEEGYHYVNRHFKRVTRRWTQWVQQRYENEEALRAAWPEYPRDGESWEKIGLPTMGDGLPLAAGKWDQGGRFRDFIACAEDLAYEWTDRMTSAIRSRDRNHLVTIGMTDWSLPFGDLYSSFSPQKVGPLLDFISIHCYPKGTESGNNAAEQEMILRAAFVGKPVVIEEFYPFGVPQIVDEFLDRSRSCVSGWISFYWGDTIEELRGRSSMKDAMQAAWLERFSVFAALNIRTPPERAPGENVVAGSLFRLRGSRDERQKMLDNFTRAIAEGQFVDVSVKP